MPKPIPYDDLRPRLITGSIILWKSPGLLPWLIRRWSEYSHASLVVRYQDECLKERVWLIEALAGGLMPRALSERLKGYQGHAYALMPPLNIIQQKQVLDFAHTECANGKKYDYLGLVGNILGRVSANARRFFCSEFVYQAMVECGRCVEVPKAPRPGDLPAWVGGTLREIQTPGG